MTASEWLMALTVVTGSFGAVLVLARRARRAEAAADALRGRERVLRERAGSLQRLARRRLAYGLRFREEIEKCHAELTALGVPERKSERIRLRLRERIRLLHLRNLAPGPDPRSEAASLTDSHSRAEG